MTELLAAAHDYIVFGAVILAAFIGLGVGATPEGEDRFTALAMLAFVLIMAAAVAFFI